MSTLLRICGISASSYWLDETLSITRASAPDWPTAYAMLKVGNHPPLYEAVLLSQWMRIGNSELIVKYLNVLLAALNLALVYLLGRVAYDYRTGLLGALLCAVSPIHVAYSKEARMYALAALLLTAAFLYLLLALRHKERRRFWIGYTVFGALSLYTHYYAGFALFCGNFFLITLATVRREWRLMRRVLLSGLAIGLLFAPWLPTFLSHTANDPVASVPPLTFSSFRRISVAYYLSEHVLGPLFPYAVALLVITVGLALLYTGRGRPPDREASNPAADWLIAGCPIGVIALSTAISQFVPFLLDRYLVPTAPLAALALAHLVMGTNRQRVLFLAGWALVLLVVTSGVAIGLVQHNEDWKGIVAYLEERTRHDDVVILSSGHMVRAFDYYSGGSIPELYVQQIAGTERESEILAASRIWLVRGHRYRVNPAGLALLDRLADGRNASCREFGGYPGATVCMYSLPESEGQLGPRGGQTSPRSISSSRPSTCSPSIRNPLWSWAFVSQMRVP